MAAARFAGGEVYRNAVSRRWRRWPTGPDRRAGRQDRRARQRRCGRAKRRVFGTVGIDMIAGPSEILVVADGANDPDWIAVDLLSQAEHDAAAQSILITDHADFAAAVAAAVDRQLATLDRADRGQSWADNGAVTEPDLDARAAGRPDRAGASGACGRRPGGLAAKVRNAGAVFLGRSRPRRSATMWPGSTTCCRPRAAPASRRAWASPIS